MGTSSTTRQSHSSGPGVQALDAWADRWFPLQRWLARHEQGTNQHIGQMAKACHISEMGKAVWAFGHNVPRVYSTKPDSYQVIRSHLAFTLFVPGGRADKARQAIAELTRLGYFNYDRRHWPKDQHCRAEVEKTIRPYVRFYRNKARNLAEGVIAFNDVPVCISDRAGIDAMHDWLLKNIRGLGKKATAHLLRNLGFFSYDYAYPIIDVHIHKALEIGNFKHGTYEEAETSFRRFSELVKIPVIALDAFVWCAYSGNWKPDAADFANFGIPITDLS